MPEICVAAVRDIAAKVDFFSEWADMGVTSIDIMESPSRQVEKAVRAAKQAGLRVIMRWPDWDELGLCSEDYSFRAYDGRFNNDGGPGLPAKSWAVKGPSVWCPEALERAAAQVQSVADMGVDGVLGGSLACDRPFPTNWYPFGDDAIKGTTMFWSFDAHAKAAWREYSDGARMPTMAICNGGVLASELVDFYSWYLDAWRQRITEIGLLAAGVSIPEVWTWFLPISHYADVTVANATAGNVLAMDRWRKDMEAAGSRPTVVTGSFGGLKSHFLEWYQSSVQTAREITSALDWNWIVGVEADNSRESCVPHILRNGAEANDLGLAGIYMGPTFFVDAEMRPKIAEALSEVQSWDWAQGGDGDDADHSTDKEDADPRRDG